MDCYDFQKLLLKTGLFTQAYDWWGCQLIGTSFVIYAGRIDIGAGEIHWYENISGDKWESPKSLRYLKFEEVFARSPSTIQIKLIEHLDIFFLKEIKDINYESF